jgi:hypothetical protein
MKGDIISNAVGFFNSCCPATVDIMNNATGSINEICVEKKLYSDVEIKNFQNALSVAKNSKAILDAEHAKAETDYYNCKKKVFCNVKPKRARLDEIDVKIKAVTLVISQFQSTLTQANDSAVASFNKCIEQQTKLIELNKVAQNDLVKKEEIENVNQSTSSPVVSPTEIESDTNKYKYGAIIAGSLVVLILGYFIIKKK